MTKSDDYIFKFSKALRGENFVGLGIDNDNEPEKQIEELKNGASKLLKKF